MAEPRVLIVHGSAALVAAVKVALAGRGAVVVADNQAPAAPQEPIPFALDTAFEARELRPGYAGYGPPPRRRKGKEVRWQRAAAINPPRGTRGRIT